MREGGETVGAPGVARLDEMARHVGVSRPTWSRIEAGASALSMDQLTKAAGKLGLPLGELMLQVDDVVRKLRRQGVNVLDSRDQTSAAKWGKARAATVAFLGGAVLGEIVLGGIVAGIMAAEDRDDG